MDIGKLLGTLGPLAGSGGGGPDPEMMANMGKMINTMVSSLNETLQVPPQQARAHVRGHEDTMPMVPPLSRIEPVELKPINIPIKIKFDDSVTGKTKKIAFNVKYLDGSIVQRKRNIHIPPGIDNGDIIRLKNIGDEYEDDKFCDINIVIEVVPHDTFTRLNNDIIVEKKISLFESLFDCNIKVPCVHNGFMVLQKKNDIIQNNTMRKVSGIGMPIKNSAEEAVEKGSLLILFKVDLGNGSFPKITTAQKESLRKLFTPTNDEWKIDSAPVSEKHMSNDINLEMKITPRRGGAAEGAGEDDYEETDRESSSSESDTSSSDGESVLSDKL